MTQTACAVLSLREISLSPPGVVVYKTGTWGANGAFPLHFCREKKEEKKNGGQFASNCLEMSPQLINTNLYRCKKGSENK